MVPNLLLPEISNQTRKKINHSFDTLNDSIQCPWSDNPNNPFKVVSLLTNLLDKSLSLTSKQTHNLATIAVRKYCSTNTVLKTFTGNIADILRSNNNLMQSS